MLLVKCKCKCVFTLDEDAMKEYRVYCPNCKCTIELNPYTSLNDRPKLSDRVESVSIVPKNAKITVTFDT